MDSIQNFQTAQRFSTATAVPEAAEYCNPVHYCKPVQYFKPAQYCKLKNQLKLSSFCEGLPVDFVKKNSDPFSLSSSPLSLNSQQTLSPSLTCHSFQLFPSLCSSHSPPNPHSPRKSLSPLPPFPPPSLFNFTPRKTPSFPPSLSSSLSTSFESEKDIEPRFCKEEDSQVNPTIADVSMGTADVIKLEDGNLLVKGVTLLSNIPSNVTVTQDMGPESKKGVFLGGTTENPNSRHIFSLGQLRGHRFLSCFRFKIWWMTQKVGNRGGEIPGETQFLLIESREEKPIENSVDACGGHTDITYIVFLPLLDGSFRTSLQGNEKDELLMCAESGDPGVTTTECRHAVYVTAGTDPFLVTSQAVRAAEDHSKSFLRREKKQLPGMLDYFGWCTWDAFYTDVSVEGVHQGLASLAEGGTPAKFLIIDDGWQSVDLDGGSQVPGEIVNQFAQRLTDLKENVKFQKQVGKKKEDFSVDLGHVVRTMKEDHNLKYVYVWHALMGYWGGVRPGKGSMDKFDPSLIFPSLPIGILEQMPDMASDTLTINGLGVIHPNKIMEFYDELHSYLSKQGVDGVKVDVQAILETLGAGYGGRVKLAKVFHEALETSVAKNFPDNGIISCMSHHTDGLYSAKQTAVIRASDDFWPRDPASHTTHIASVSYNSLFLGEFMQPDWDMFHSRHPAAEYHGAARAIGGCAVYVSDKPREHDFNLLRKLVLPDGTVLRALLPGRPSRSSLFVDPARDRQSMLKIWNLNSCTGVVGAFNCQGAGWCRVDRKYSIHDLNPGTVSGSIFSMDVDALKSLIREGEEWEGETAVYSHKEGELRRLSESESISVSLKSLDFEIYTVSPIKKMTSSLEFAPIGLIHMFNSGGAILAVDFLSPKAAKIAVRGCGDFGAFSSEKPLNCSVDSREVDFTYDSVQRKLVIGLEHRAGHVWNVVVDF